MGKDRDKICMWFTGTFVWHGQAPLPSFPSTFLHQPPVLLLQILVQKPQAVLLLG